ncbi:MAG TPA: ThuA domain-containing protein [Candidatus Sulfotelmatobacter sp.]|nr:ThuA domain-containing protein [Candidatus Sulfotelmatobacter sp.]
MRRRALTLGLIAIAGALVASGPVSGGAGVVSASVSPPGDAKVPAFKALAFYSTDVEPDHVKTAKDALAFDQELAAKNNFVLDTTTDWTRLNENDLKPYRMILWLNNFPQTPEQRAAFQKYMENGGGWIGYHVAGYNDKDTHWPWFVDFLGGAAFYTNNWPVKPAKLRIDDPHHPVTAGMPATYDSPANEWYLWKPSPRLDPRVHVLVTLDPSNYPIGVKDVIMEGDLPVVWTNTKYRMLYINMGHGPAVYEDATQNRLFSNAILWVGRGK